ncbi:hypothetical protein CRG98_035927 [Punica granatum]|uniref:Uncharacterized protein n=1 Tax=Punica granatum TaxID=22663 RepID=A0A2I0IIU1_PUNGR|nr:hypothetical protein CRG98_035927 [Punica granatum]
MISQVLGVVGSEGCETRTSTFHQMSFECWIPFERGPFFQVEVHSGDQVESRRAIRNLFQGPGGPWVRAGPLPGVIYLSLDRAPGSPVRKGACESSGVPWLRQDASEVRPDMSSITLAPRGIFRVPYWAPFDASVTR